MRLADDAAGNPLYITELIAALTRSSRVTDTDTGVADDRGRFRARLAVGRHRGSARLRGRAGA